MSRLEAVRRLVGDLIRLHADGDQRRAGFIHLYGVSTVCRLLAMKRGLDAELGAVVGLLHDIANYHPEETADHAQQGAAEAERILREAGGFTKAEIDLVCRAIRRHADKEAVHEPYDELLKDGDVLQHYLYDGAYKSEEAKRRRQQQVLQELGVA